MRSWDDRDSFLRRTTRKVRDMEIADKCRDGYEKAAEVGREYTEKAVGFAKDAASKVKNSGIDKKVVSVIEDIKDRASFGFCNENCKIKEKACEAKSKISAKARSFARKVREKNPIAVAICVGTAVFAVFGIFYSIFYTVFSLAKRRR